VCWDVNVIAWIHVDCLFVALEKQLGFIVQHHNSFGFFVIVPQLFETCVASGDDSLDPK